MKCRTAIIPVAGYGTRRLPITKAVEKCMLPVLNRPVVDYIVQDCIVAGIKEFYFVVSEDCMQLKQYYSHNRALEAHLREHGKEKMLSLIEPPTDITFHFVTQPPHGAYGTAVPVWLCRDLIPPHEQVLVIMGDNFLWNADGSSEAAYFIDEATKTNAQSALLGVEVPKHEVPQYGVLATEERGNVRYFTHVVEKPKVEEAPSSLINVSFYLFDPGFFNFLETYINQPRTGEYFITDPLNMYVAAGNELAVIPNKGEYLDCGTVDGWLYTNERVRKTTT